MNNEITSSKHLVCEEAVIEQIYPLGQQAGEDIKYAELHILVSGKAWEQSYAGQFVMIRPIERNKLPVQLAWGHDVLWGRAFSICRLEKTCSETFRLVLFLQLAGRATPLLLGLNAGDKLLIWGPLGNGFVVEPDSQTLMLAGGLGIAPFVGYSQKHPQAGNLELLFGHRVDLSCYPLKELPEQVRFFPYLEKNNQDLQSFLGTVEERIKATAEINGLVLACGPEPFLKFIHKIVIGCGARAQLSLETQMACGSGACLGCTVKSGPAFKHAPQEDWPIQVCMHGPVFWADEVNFD